MSIVLFIFVILVLVVSHELGHFLIAKYFKIRVDEFAVGFPPKLFSFLYGGTEYSINALPFGGFVKIFGEDYDTTDDTLGGAESFIHKPRSIQALVILGGVVANFFVAWVLFSSSFFLGVQTPLSPESEFRPYAENIIFTVTGVVPNSPAYASDFKAGDEIVSVSFGKEKLSTLTPLGVQEFISRHSDKAVSFELRRAGEIKTHTVAPKEGVVAGKFVIGIMMSDVGTVSLPPTIALKEGFISMYTMSVQTVNGFWGLIKGAVQGEKVFEQLTGPVGIVGLVGDAGRIGFSYLLSFTAFISINLAVLNLIPFPALDGGRLLFVGIEAVLGRPLNKKIFNLTNGIGFVLLAFLMVLVTYQDIIRLISP